MVKYNSAEELLSKMTLEEKVAQMQCLYVQDIVNKSGEFDFDAIGPNGLGGFAFERVEMPFTVEEEVQILNRIWRYCTEETRLGIPPIIHAEALHGLCLRGATSFPQSIALAAMFDTDAMSECAAVIAEECKNRGISQVLSPVVDIATDLRWGRVEETYGEDHVLAARMAVSFCEQFTRRNITPTIKHFVANSGAGGRDSAAVFPSEVELKQRFLYPYKECIQKAGVKSVMASYNSVDGIPVGLNRRLLVDMLRGDCGFDGYVVTDYGLINACQKLHRISDDLEVLGALAVKAGLDREIPDFQGGYRYLTAAVAHGLISEEDIDTCVLNILKVKFDLGLFQKSYAAVPGLSEYSDTPQSREISYRTALKSICLLKNDGVLPLKKGGRTAILGKYALSPKLGGYSTWGIRVDSIKDVFGECDYIDLEIDSKNKFTAIEEKYLSCLTSDTSEASGLFGYFKDNKEYSFQPVITRNDKTICFGGSEGGDAVLEPLGRDKEYSVHWLGFITPPKTGAYLFKLELNGGGFLSIDGEVLIDRFSDPVSGELTACVELIEGQRYHIDIGYSTSGSRPKIRLLWNYDEDFAPERIDYAKRLANYDTVLLPVSVDEGEGCDRANLNLCHTVSHFIDELYACGKKIVLIVFSGSTVIPDRSMDKINAMINAWYTGSEQSRALHDVIFGVYNPAGRLPFTFPRHVAQCPMTYNAFPRGRNSGYGDISNQPLFPFGYGLSYTNFEYSDLCIEGRKVSFTVQNVGEREGEEVVQLYINGQNMLRSTPAKQLWEFKRIFLARGEKKTLTFELTDDTLSILNSDLQWELGKGRFTIMVGSNSEDIRLQGFYNG